VMLLVSTLAVESLASLDTSPPVGPGSGRF
jgi:hypothetical protein